MVSAQIGAMGAKDPIGSKPRFLSEAEMAFTFVPPSSSVYPSGVAIRHRLGPELATAAGEILDHHVLAQPRG